MSTCHCTSTHNCVLCGRCCCFYLTQLLTKSYLMYYLKKWHWHDFRTKTRARRKRRSRMSWGSSESTSSVSTSVSASLVTDWQEPPRCWNNWLASNLSSLKVTHLVIFTWKIPLTFNSISIKIWCLGLLNLEFY